MTTPGQVFEGMGLNRNIKELKRANDIGSEALYMHEHVHAWILDTVSQRKKGLWQTGL